MAILGSPGKGELIHHPPTPVTWLKVVNEKRMDLRESWSTCTLSSMGWSRSSKHRYVVTPYVPAREGRVQTITTIQRKVIGQNFDVVTLQCIVYVGEISNPSFHSDPHWIAKVARRIATSAGPSGTNREYLYNLAAAIRGLSTVEDPYLVLLERLVRAEVALQEKQRALGVD